MNTEITFEQLKQGDTVNFQLKHWHHTNWQAVRVLYKSDTYVIVLNLARHTEYCINISDYEEPRKPQFRTVSYEKELKPAVTKYSVCVETKLGHLKLQRVIKQALKVILMVHRTKVELLSIEERN